MLQCLQELQIGYCHEINPFDGHCASFRIYRKMVWTILRYTR